MNQAIIETLNDPQLLANQKYHINRLKRMYSGEKLDAPFVLSGYAGVAHADPAIDPEKWVEECLTDLYEHAELAADKDIFRPLCAQPWMFGVHFTDKVFGSPVEPYGDIFWSPGVDNELGELPVPDLEKNELWKQAQRVILALVDTGVKLPFYATQVLGEPWNQFFNLYRDDALCGVYEDPEAVKRDLGVITDTLIQMHNWFRSVIPADQYQPIEPQYRFQPNGCGQMCGCATHLISNDIYEEFVRPQDERVAALFSRGVMLHLCGSHARHIKSWREMPGICAYQLNDRAMEDLGAFYQNTRDDQILYLLPTKNVPVPRIMELTEGGNRSVISIYELENRAKRFLRFEEAQGAEFCR